MLPAFFSLSVSRFVLRKCALMWILFIYWAWCFAANSLDIMIILVWRDNACAMCVCCVCGALGKWKIKKSVFGGFSDGFGGIYFYFIFHNKAIRLIGLGRNWNRENSHHFTINHIYMFSRHIIPFTYSKYVKHVCIIRGKNNLLQIKTEQQFIHGSLQKFHLFPIKIFKL